MEILRLKKNGRITDSGRHAWVEVLEEDGRVKRIKGQESSRVIYTPLTNDVEDIQLRLIY